MNLSIITASPGLAHSLARDAQALDAALHLHVRTGDASVAARELRERQPDLLALELPHVGATELAQLEAAMAAHPGVALILLTPEATPATLMGAMRAGVREVVALPPGPGDFLQACARQQQRLRARVRAQRAATHARTFAFVPAKGGAGATLLATNFAHALACRGRRVVLVDLNLHAGDAALLLTDQVPAMTLADLALQEQRLDGALFDSALLDCGPNLKLLAAPERLEQVLALRPETVEHILQLARSRFDEVVVDLARAPDAVTIKALEFVDEAWLVVQAAVPHLHGGKRWLAMLRELGCQPRRLGLVLNRCGRTTELGPADFRRGLGVDELREVPDSPATVAHAVDHGVPVAVHAPRDPVARALAGWAEAVAPGPASASARGGWLRGLVRRRPEGVVEAAAERELAT